MLLHESRRAARTSPTGEIILLDDQDRSLWNRNQIAEGKSLVAQALSQRFGPYTLQAAIAAVHADAPSAAATDWGQIVALYDVLSRVTPSPVVELNRAVAVAMRDGPQVGLEQIDAILARGDLADYHLAHAARADMCRRLERIADARASYQQALALPARSRNGDFSRADWPNWAKKDFLPTVDFGPSPHDYLVSTGQNHFKEVNFIMQAIKPCLWFDTQALDAAKFYVSIFKNSKLGNVSYYGEGAPLPKGTVLTVSFQLNGQEFMGLNGGPMFKFTEAVSFVVNCETQAEIDDYWTKLTAGGGQAVQCGWLKDKYGLSWQIVPTALGKMMEDKDPAKTNRVMQALMKMVKLDVNDLQKAFRGEYAITST